MSIEVFRKSEISACSASLPTRFEGAAERVSRLMAFRRPLFVLQILFEILLWIKDLSKQEDLSTWVKFPDFSFILSQVKPPSLFTSILETIHSG